MSIKLSLTLENWFVQPSQVVTRCYYRRLELNKIIMHPYCFGWCHHHHHHHHHSAFSCRAIGEDLVILFLFYFTNMVIACLPLNRVGSPKRRSFYLCNRILYEIKKTRTSFPSPILFVFITILIVTTFNLKFMASPVFFFT